MANSDIHETALQVQDFALRIALGLSCNLRRLGNCCRKVQSRAAIRMFVTTSTFPRSLVMSLTSIHRFVCLTLVTSSALLAMTSLLQAAHERGATTSPTVSASARTEQDVKDAEAAEDGSDYAPPS